MSSLRVSQILLAFQIFLVGFCISLSSFGRIRSPSSHDFSPFVFMIRRDDFVGFFFLPQKTCLAEVSDGGDIELVILLLESVLEDPLRIFCLTTAVSPCFSQ